MTDRRRALMMAVQGGNDDSIIYELLNHTIQTGDTIDTGVAPFGADLDATIMLDFNQTSYVSTSGASGSLSKYMITTISGNSKFALGKYGRSDAPVRHWWMNGSSYTSITGTGNSADRKRIIVTHQRNSGTITIHIKTGSNAKQTVTVTNTFTASALPLHFGGSGTNALCAGSINMARIYNRILEQSEIDAFFA